MYDLHVYDIVNSNMTKILFLKIFLKLQLEEKVRCGHGFNQIYPDRSVLKK